MNKEKLVKYAVRVVLMMIFDVNVALVQACFLLLYNMYYTLLYIYKTVVRLGFCVVCLCFLSNKSLLISTFVSSLKCISNTILMLRTVNKMYIV